MERLLNHTRYFLIFIVTSSLGITYLHYTTVPRILELHNIFTELYYVPILLGAIAFGLKGAVWTYLFVTALYAPYVFINWSGTYLFVANKIFHALFSAAFAVLAGVLTDRERKRREQADKDLYLAGLGRASASIAHDLKNPIISILGFSRRIREGKGNVDTASQSVISSAENMQDIVHNVLDFARPVKLDLKEADINSVIKRVCNSCETKAMEEGVVLTIQLPDEPVKYMLDRIHMERALINLINNAVEASKKGDVVAVRAETEVDKVTISIRDYGEGMDKETLENIFIPFYTSKSSGTGIGMAITKKVIEGHNGKIRVTSQPGTGTEVLIKLGLPNKLT